MKTKPKYKRVHCDSCEMLAINGVACHEIGCPKSHIGTTRECEWCGSEFEPESKHQRFCDESCAEAYYG